MGIRSASRISSSSTNVLWNLRQVSQTTNLSLLAITSTRSFYKPQTRVIGIKSFRSTVPQKIQKFGIPQQVKTFDLTANHLLALKFHRKIIKLRALSIMKRHMDTSSINNHSRDTQSLGKMEYIGHIPIK